MGCFFMHLSDCWCYWGTAGMNIISPFIHHFRERNDKPVKKSTVLCVLVNVAFHKAFQLRYSKPLIENGSVADAGRGVIAWKPDDRRKCL